MYWSWLYQVMNSWSRALTIITKARPWDAPKSGQVFHFIRAREAFRSGVRRSGCYPFSAASLPWHWIGGGGGGVQMDSPDKMRREGE